MQLCESDSEELFGSLVTVVNGGIATVTEGQKCKLYQHLNTLVLKGWSQAKALREAHDELVTATHQCPSQLWTADRT